MAALLAHIDVLIKDEFTSDLSTQYVIDEKTHVVTFVGIGSNFDLQTEAIEKKIGHKLHPLVTDLYRIASSVYVSDLRFKRSTRYHTRSISILISVSNKRLWDAEKQHIESTLRILSGDNFTFHFIQGQYPDREFEFNRNANTEAIALFSGGLDSLAGIKWTTNRNISPFVVSHDSNNKKITHVQVAIYVILQKIFANKLKILQIKARSRSSKLKSKELTQKTRSFLYLTLGSIIGLESGISNVYLFENGVLALNIPITTSRIFSNTKTAHPTYIANFNRIISGIFPNTVSVENPFVSLTKGEAIQVLNDNNYHPAIKETLTCSRAFHLQIQSGITEKHCGICVPCILRRVSIHHARLWNHDDEYAHDILGDFDTIPQDGKTVLFQLLNFIRNMQKNVDDILIDYPEFYIEDVDPQLSIEMMRRYGNELKEMIQDKGSISLVQNVSGLL